MKKKEQLQEDLGKLNEFGAKLKLKLILDFANSNSFFFLNHQTQTQNFWGAKLQLKMHAKKIYSKKKNIWPHYEIDFFGCRFKTKKKVET